MIQFANPHHIYLFNCQACMPEMAFCALFSCTHNINTPFNKCIKALPKVFLIETPISLNKRLLAQQRTLQLDLSLVGRVAGIPNWPLHQRRPIIFDDTIQHDPNPEHCLRYRGMTPKNKTSVGWTLAGLTSEINKDGKTSSRLRRRTQIHKTDNKRSYITYREEHRKIHQHCTLSNSGIAQGTSTLTDPLCPHRRHP